MAFNSAEICTLTVNGKIYRDWKTILVYLCTAEVPNYYRFTCTEGAPLMKDWAEIRIKPGDHCTVRLGGEYAIGGYVTSRQVAYTATHHGIEITGKSYTFATVMGAAQIKDGELTNVSFTELATKLLGPYGIMFEPRGGVNNKPFDRVNVVGQTTWEVLDAHSRARNIRLGTNPKNGASIIGAPPSYFQAFGRAIEGVNILEGRETISMEFGSGPDLASAQAAPTPKEWGAMITSGPFGNATNNFAKMIGVAGMYMPTYGMLEIPGKMEDAKTRGQSESLANNGERVKVEVVLQGWFRPAGGLWQPYDKVYVRSPMLIMNESLTCRSVTFTQDDRSGTRTTLELERDLTGEGKADLSSSSSSK